MLKMFYYNLKTLHKGLGKQNICIWNIAFLVNK